MLNGSLFADLRQDIRDATLCDETTLARRLMEQADIGADARDRAQREAADFVRDARATAGRSSLIDKFLQEYGLSTAEGVTLMRLAEALLRTPDATTADALIKDKVDAGDWSAHQGKSPFPLVNFSTRALMMTAAWLDDIEAKDPTRQVVKSTKALLDRAGDPVIRAAVGQAMRIMGEHFVLGQTIDEALKRGRDAAARGYTFSFDMLGEAALTADDADRFFHEYSNAITQIAKASNSEKAEDNPGISIKLSALHPRYEYNKRDRVMAELYPRIKSLAMQARASNLGLNIDAEEADRLDISLDLISQCLCDPDLAGWDGFGVVVQAYQRRALPVLRWLATLARAQDRRIMVRLVKGAYWDGEIKRAQVMGLETYPVFTRKVLTDISYAAAARFMLDNTDVFYAQFATHNALTATLSREMAQDIASFEIQRLHGMGEALHDRLLEKGTRSRIYAPVGGHKELLPYLVRRLLENGANSSFVNQLIDPDLSVDDIVADPIKEAQLLSELSNSAIPAPRDLFAGERQSAKGWDETDPDTAQSLEAAVALRNDTGSPGSASTGLPPSTATSLINGAGKQGADEKTDDAARTPVLSPANRQHTVGFVAPATTADVAEAISEAQTAQPEWVQTGAHLRGDILRRAADMLEAEGEHFIRLATHEAGKTIPDGIAEVREAVDFLRYYAGEAVRHESDETAPLGVVACISPWNFPLAIYLGQITGALAAGNAVIAKPAEQTPLIAYEATKLLHRAGVPAGVLHFLPGDGPSVGGPLVAHHGVHGVLFTGSTHTAHIINRALADRPDAVLIAETGGVNAMIIDSTALLEQAVHDVIASAFQSAGQRCSACRLVCVQDDIAERFEEMLRGAMAELTLGDPSSLSTDVGPIIDDDAKRNIDAAIARLDTHAEIIAKTPTPDHDSAHPLHEGCFVAPVAYRVNSIDAVREEIFGPVLQVVRYKAEDLSGLVERINSTGYGLTLGIHTRIDETMHEVVSRARIGNVYVNRNQIGAVVGVQPFGGEGLSGTGPKAGGPNYVGALRKARAADSAPNGQNQLSPEQPDRARVNTPNGAVTEDAPGLLDQTLAGAVKAFTAWHRTADKRAVFIKAAAYAASETAAAPGIADILRQAATFAAARELPIDLPGPTGESNTLRARGRGVAYVHGALGADPAPAGAVERFGFLMAKMLGAGNAVISLSPVSEKLDTYLARAGAPKGLVHRLAYGAQAPAPLLRDARLRLVGVDHANTDIHPFRRILTERDGAIIPILGPSDNLWRFGVERTLSINTTAAGGDVRLLSLPE